MTWIAAGTAAAGLVSSVIGSRSAKRAAKQQGEAAQRGIALNENIYNTARADNQPYMRLGDQSANMLLRGLGDGTDGDLTRRFSMADFTKDPGYDFRMSEGARGLEGSAAARGGVLSGAAQKALTKYGQNFASNEYGNAYNRYNTDQGNRYNRLLGGTTVGQNAVGQVGNAGANYGRSATDLITGQGNAASAGTMGSNNAIQSGIGTITGAAQDWAARQRTYSGGDLAASNADWYRRRAPQPYGEG